MADDKNDDASQEGSPEKGSPPTDLEVTEISGAANDAASGDAAELTEDDRQAIGEQPVPPPRAPSRTASAAIAAMTGAIAAGLVVGAMWLAGWPPSSSAPQISVAEFGDLSSRVAGVESKAGKPAASALDPAAVARIDDLEKSVASLRSDLATAREQSDKLAAAGKDETSMPHEGVDAPDLAAISARLAEVEQAAKTRTSEITGHDTAPATDVPIRRVVAATLLNVSARQGQPYGELLAASKALISDPGTLKSLERFADSGVPSANVLSRELLAIVPKLAPASASVTATTGTGIGIVDRLQEGAARLVRIERSDAPVGDPAGSVVERITASARQNDVAAAREGLNALPPADRTAAEPWIAKADARDAALAASHQFAADAMAALVKPAP